MAVDNAVESLTRGSPVEPHELRARRLALGLTQNELAQTIGVTRTYLGLMERGKKAISQRIADAVCRAGPQSLDQISRETDPLMRAIEIALIEAGLPFERKFRSGDGLFDFYLRELALGIVVQRDQMSPILKTADVRDIIIANGKLAAEAIATLITGQSLQLLKPKLLPIEI